LGFLLSASAGIYEFDLKDLRLQRSRTIVGFKIGSIAAAGALLYLGGEAIDGCAMQGRAAIYRLQADGEASLFWNEDTPFASDVVGMKVLDDQLLATVRYQRTLGIETRTSSSDGYNKRLWDDNSASLESALLYLDRTGRVAGRINFSAGLAVFVDGMEMIGRRPVLYGAVGGIPAVALQ
jgi:hypothetical protein